MKRLLAAIAFATGPPLVAYGETNPWPENLPQDFEKTPYQFICQTETPRRAYEKYYFVLGSVEEQEIFRIIVLGAGGKNSTTLWQRSDRDAVQVTAYVMTDNGWQEDGGLAGMIAVSERMGVPPGAAVQNYTDTEWQQLKPCLLLGLNTVQEKLIQ